MNPVIIGSVVLAEDEDGVIWDISGRAFPFEMTPHKLPDGYEASYEFKTSYRRMVAQGKGEADARQKLLKSNRWMKEEDVRFEQARVAVSEADEIMSAEDFRDLINRLEFERKPVKKPAKK